MPECIRFRSVLFVLHTPIDTSLQITDIVRILAHSLTIHIRDLRNILSVAQSCLHDNIQCRHTRIISYIGTDTECYLGSSLEMTEDSVRFLEIQAVREKKRLRSRVNAQRLIMRDHLLAPFDRIAGIMPHTREKRRIRLPFL